MRSDPEREAEHSENLPAVKGCDGRSQKSEMTSRHPGRVPGSPEAGHSKWRGIQAYAGMTHNHAAGKNACPAGRDGLRAAPPHQMSPRRMTGSARAN